MADQHPTSAEALGWRRNGAWQGIVSAGRHGLADGAATGIVATLHANLSTASLIVADDGAREASRATEAAFGVALPKTPKAVMADDMTFVWSGPGHWVAVSPYGELVPRLRAVLDPSVAIADQSDARAIVTLAGPPVRDVLAKGCMLDLHPRAFGIGDAAVSVIAYVGVQLWRLAEEPAGFRVSVSRSFAGSFWAWLQAASAEFGLEARHD